METEKKLILHEQLSFDTFDMFNDESLDNAIINLSKFKEKIDKEYIAKGYIIGNIRIEQWYDSIDQYIEIYREETDEEYQARIKEELRKAEIARKRKETREANRQKHEEKKRMAELSEIEALREKLNKLEQKHNERNSVSN